MFREYSKEFLTNKFKNPVETGLTLIIYAKECNKKCKYCLWGDDNSHSDLTLDKELIEQELIKAKEKSVSLIYTGGEPFFDKETLQYVKELINRNVSKFSSVTILSNMDYYEKFDVDFFPVCIIAHNNYKKIYPFRMDGVFIWNTIWIDDVRGDKLIYSDKYSYLFRMKFKTLYNKEFVPDDEVNRFLIEEILHKLDFIGAGINFIWPDSLSRVKSLVKLWNTPEFLHNRDVFQPSSIQRTSFRSNVCKTCPYTTCSEAIEKDDCAAMNKICYSCKYTSICPMTSFNADSVDISFYKKCSTLKWLLNLKEQYVRS